ncbi:MAG TPA: alanine--tRNA ligase [Mycobacteriales bacterium]|nr:alanine--tRNA ligase [Mycobacteriales bacterium]
MKTSEIRQRFLDHFARNGHTVVSSASLLLDDPNLLFVNAGMVPFKPYFLGQQTPPYSRATSVQKCVRTVDIEEVGKTTRHGSFFQMNGNFSFGDYFKEDAIRLAWELITKPVTDGGFGFDESRLWATVYHDDDEAFSLWRDKIGVPESRIVRRGMTDNFWSMGIPGPCGPCSEIYIDRGPAYGREGGPEVDEDRYLEFWNLVFMQFERGAGPAKEGYEILGELPAKNIDTGMGLERMSALLQGVDNLYEIDEMVGVINRASELTGKEYGKNSGPSAGEAHPDDVRFRVVADHVRTGLMMIGDGVTPGNEGRGYVLRRILRRAIRAMRLLGCEDPVLPELMPVSRDVMKASYPEIETDFARISGIAYAEEEAFRQTLRQGTTIFDTTVAQLRDAGKSELSGAQAFALHDTYGFPIDLTLEMAGEQQLSVDQEGFRVLMGEQRARAKADATARKTGHGDTAVFRSVLDDNGPTRWLAYETLETDSRVLALLCDGQPVTAARAGDIVTVILDRTPFYAESGGQDSDAGVVCGSGMRGEVIDVQRPIKGLIAHSVRILDGELGMGEQLHAEVDVEWRTGARQAHSGTHVIHAALREILGPTALQSGSYNRPGYLRLDFAWRSALSPDSRSDVEQAANSAIRRDFPVDVKYMTLPEAKSLGALALFGETYDETVRVVEIGGEWSRELCGGTHVSHSSQIGLVTITSESSVGAGQRRVEAVTGIEAFAYLARERDLVSQLAEQLKAPREELPERVSALLARMKNVERESAQLRGRVLAAQAGERAAAAVDVDGVAYVGLVATSEVEPSDLRGYARQIIERIDAHRPAVVAILTAPSGADAGTPLSLVVHVNESARSRGHSASQFVKQALAGRGGGSDEVAQGGGADPAAADTVLAAIRDGIDGRAGVAR